MPSAKHMNENIFLDPIMSIIHRKIQERIQRTYVGISPEFTGIPGRRCQAEQGGLLFACHVTLRTDGLPFVKA